MTLPPGVLHEVEGETNRPENPRLAPSSHVMTASAETNATRRGKRRTQKSGSDL